MDIPEVKVTEMTPCADGSTMFKMEDGGVFLAFEGIHVVFAPVGDSGEVHCSVTRADTPTESTPILGHEAAWLAIQLMDVYFPDLADMCRQVMEIKRQLIDQGREVNGISVLPLDQDASPGTGFYL